MRHDLAVGKADLLDITVPGKVWSHVDSINGLIRFPVHNSNEIDHIFVVIEIIPVDIIA